MSDNLLKPIKSLRTSSDLRGFSQMRALDLKNFFPSLWHSVLELLIINKFFHIALQVFINTIFFYPECRKPEFEKKHNKIISDFTSALNKQDLAKSKQLLNNQKIWVLLESISKFIPDDPDSRIAPLFPLLSCARINVIEKTDDYEDYPWEVKDAVLSVSLFENGKDYFLLHPKSRIQIPEFNVPDEALTNDEDSVLVMENDNSVLDLEEDHDLLEAHQGSFVENGENLDVSNEEKEKSVKFNHEIIVTKDNPPSSSENSPLKSVLKKKNSEDHDLKLSENENIGNKEVSEEFTQAENIINEEICEEHKNETVEYYEEIHQNTVITEKKIETVTYREEKKTESVTKQGKTFESVTKEETKYQSSSKITEKQSKYEPVVKEVEENYYEEQYYEEEDEEIEPPVVCGSLACVKCARDLNKTSHFLMNSFCCSQNLYDSKSIPIPRKASPQVPSKSCAMCKKAASKPSTLYCLCCFLNLNIWKTKNFESSEGCNIADLNKWVDISIGQPKELLQCNFCDEFRNKKFVFYACPSCDDLVCVVCLRKNNYISEGSCNRCHCKRKIAVV